jgi:hypothetical protein
MSMVKRFIGSDGASSDGAFDFFGDRTGFSAGSADTGFAWTGATSASADCP